MEKLLQIKAAAGSGKTYALTGEVLQLLALNGRESGVAAITFTNRAAAEMKERVLARLKGLALGVEKNPEWSHENAAKMVDELIQEPLNIRTIDSLIHLLVRVSALELGLPPDFEPVFEERDIFKPVLEELAQKAWDEDDELKEEFFAACREVVIGEGKGFLAGEKLEKAVSNVAAWILLHNGEGLADTTAIVDARNKLLATCREEAKKLEQLVQGEGLKATALLKVLGKIAVLDGGKLPSAAALNKKCLEDALNNGSAAPGEKAQSTFAALSSHWQALETEGAVLKAARSHAPYVRLAKKVLEQLPESLAKGMVPHALMPRLAFAALCGEFGLSGAMCRLGESIRHLLVDEFQDTNPEQWEALKPLAVQALSEGGSLALVGDEKQAIYGWRGGDSTLFDLVFEDKDVAGLSTVERRVLNSNWRSRENIVSWNNAVFGRLAGLDEATDIMTELLPLKGGPCVGLAAGLTAKIYAAAVQQCKGEAGGLVRLDWLDASDVSEADEETQAEKESQEAEEDSLKPGDRLAVNMLCRRASELGGPWKDMAVLVRTNNQAKWAAEGLMAAGIPVVTSGSLLLGEQPLIREMANLLACLCSPEDDAAFLALLLGRRVLPRPMEQAEVHNWLCRHPRGLCRAFAADYPEFWHNNLKEAFELAKKLGPYDLTQALMRRFDLFRRYPGVAFFLERFLEVIYLAETKGLGDLPAFLRHWKEKGDQEKAPLPDGLNAVRIMTIHKSKGLEFPIVFVPWNDITPKASRELCRAEAGGLAVLAPWNKGMGGMYQAHLAAQAVECLNLLYVAWTRAKDQLHIFLSTNMKKGGNRAAEALAAGSGLFGNMKRLQNGALLLGEAPQRQMEEPEAATPTLRPLASAWLPRLKVYRSPLSQLLPEEEGGDEEQARRRGILAHACLEELAGCPEPLIARRGFGERWARQPDFEAVRPGVDWFLNLPQAPDWLASGLPEQSLMDAEGNLHRMDLLGAGPQGYVVLEYKTGATGALPKPEHVRQIKDYLRLLALARPQPAKGVLVYLDRHELFEIEGENA